MVTLRGESLGVTPTQSLLSHPTRWDDLGGGQPGELVSF